MRQIQFTYLEEKLLNEIVRPALLSAERPDHLGSMSMISQTLNFVVLLEGVKNFYHQNNGTTAGWFEVLREADL